MSDGLITLRAFVVGDRASVLAGRDREWERWLGPGSADPSPTACIEVDGLVVGWIDADETAPWLQPGEANVGYSVFPEHRGHGYAARAVRLFVTVLHERGVRRALLVIEPENTASHRVARSAGAQVHAGRIIAEHASSVVYVIERGGGGHEPT